MPYPIFETINVFAKFYQLLHHMIWSIFHKEGIKPNLAMAHHDRKTIGHYWLGYLENVALHGEGQPMLHDEGNNFDPIRYVA